LSPRARHECGFPNDCLTVSLQIGLSKTSRIATPSHRIIFVASGWFEVAQAVFKSSHMRYVSTGIYSLLPGKPRQVLQLWFPHLGLLTLTLKAGSQTAFPTALHTSNAMPDLEYVGQVAPFWQAAPVGEFCHRSVDLIFEKEENGAKVEARVLSLPGTVRYSKLDIPLFPSSLADASTSSPQQEVDMYDNANDGVPSAENSDFNTSQSINNLPTQPTRRALYQRHQKLSCMDVIDLDPARLTLFIRVSFNCRH
jgi:hypothetical protein